MSPSPPSAPRGVLIIEDDDVIRDQLRLALTAARLPVEAAATGAAGLRRFEQGRPLLVLLDLGLPDMDGFALCRALRTADGSVVIVVLTAQHAELDVIAALESGADDYLFKPVKLVELTARLRAHLRRREQGAAVEAESTRVGDLVVDLASREVWVQEEVLPVRPREFDLLARFTAAPGRALGRQQLLDEVWDPAWAGSGKTLDTHVLALRRKLAEAQRRRPTATVPVISTVRGFGYRLDGR